jgi:hypothetical protein
MRRDGRRWRAGDRCEIGGERRKEEEEGGGGRISGVGEGEGREETDKGGEEEAEEAK